MQFDYVIAGAGTAGCVLANRLSADPQIKVLLLEAGGRDDWIWIHIPVGYLYCIGNPRTDWCYRTEPDPGLNGRSILYARGKVLGGCSSINATYLSARRDYDEWAGITGDAAGAEPVLPVFKKSEDYWRRRRGARRGGRRVERQRLSWEISSITASDGAGRDSGELRFQSRDNEGCGFSSSTRSAARWNTSGFLRPVMNRPNLSVFTGAHVPRLRMTRRCQGIEFQRGRRRVRRSAPETILAAGSIGSPWILQLSGTVRRLCCGAWHSQKELPGVGENPQDHLQLRTTSRSGTLSRSISANSLF
jgi:choline dehydrogenase